LTTNSAAPRLKDIGTVAAAERAEFEQNSRYRVVVTYHDSFEASATVATNLLKALADKGYKAIDGRWAPGVPTKFDSVRVHYRPACHDVATRIGDIVRNVLDRSGLRTAIEVVGQDMTPLGGYDVVVFVGG
jgi:hypothetical protein